jgi:hypothetical protein
MKNAVLMLAGIAAISVVGCAAPHPRCEPGTVMALPANVYIGRVTVSSREEAAKSNAELQAKMRDWEAEARSRLLQTLTAKGYRIVTDAPEAVGVTLTWNLDVDVRYGGRAMRDGVGFNLGNGSVHSTIVIDDGAKAGRYSSRVASDLAMSPFGADIGKVVHENLERLMATIPAPRV